MSSLLHNLTYLLFLNSFLFLITFSVFLNSFQNYFFKWLACLQVSSVLLNCNIMVFLSFFCIQLFPTFFMIQVFPGPGSGFGSGCRFYKSPYTWGCLCDNWKPRFCLFLDLTGVHFRGELQHFGDVSEQKNQVLTNQNSRNSWCQIVRRTIKHTLKTKKTKYKTIKNTIASNIHLNHTFWVNAARTFHIFIYIYQFLTQENWN